MKTNLFYTRAIFLFGWLLVFNLAKAQQEKYQTDDTDILFDKRDGEEYDIVKIGETWWMQESLRYESRYSHCPNFNKRESDCWDGNFYSYTELDTICPEGWRVAGVEDWEAIFEWSLLALGVDPQTILVDSLLERDKLAADELKHSIMFTENTDRLNLFSATHPLQLKASGWVEGWKRKDMETISLWAIDPITEDPRFHLHIGPAVYVKHTHAHNIDDKPKRNRKFQLRCVCDSSQSGR
ncbi:MAG: FISUMP domain-containing protein [Bacteroidota bacterium]